MTPFPISLLGTALEPISVVQKSKGSPSLGVAIIVVLYFFV